MNSYDKKITKLLFKNFSSLKEILYDPEKARREVVEFGKKNIYDYCGTLTSGGLKAEGKEPKKNPYFKTSKEAKMQYEKELLEYLNSLQHFTIIKWRTCPAIEKTELGYKIYSRIIAN